jgi:DNA-binding transcriptional LysR family regulator
MKPRDLQETALRYFLEVARGGSITAASQRLNVVPSAISRQITGLEEVMGTALFERRPRGMVLSAAGEVLFAHARREALEAERVVGEIAALKGGERGTVRLSCTEGFAVDLLPRAIAAFQQLHPQITFRMQVFGLSSEVTSQISEGDADIGITFSRQSAKGVKVEHRQRVPTVAVMRRDHPLARLKQVSLSQLAAYPIALTGPGSTVRELFDIGCSNQQLLVEPVLTSNFFQAQYVFAAVGGGICIAGDVSVRHLAAAGDMVIVPISDRGMDARHIEVQTMADRTLPHATRTFLAFLKQRIKAAAAPRPAR